MLPTIAVDCKLMLVRAVRDDRVVGIDPLMP